MRRDWIETRLEDLRASGKNKTGLAAAMGIQPPRISALISGARKKLAMTEIHGLASYLEYSEAEVLALLSGGAIRPAETEPVVVVGAVQAGIWREAVEWEAEERYPVLHQRMRKYSRFPQFGLEVVGPSMNKHYPEGSVVVCVSYEDLGREPEHGERVVCCRMSNQGVEATVKEYRRDARGDYWLWPISDHPDFQQPWRVPKGGEHADSDIIRITALVIGCVKSEA